MRIPKHVKMIMVQFTFQNRKDIPDSIPSIGQETADHLRWRKKNYTSGKEVISLTENCSVATILDEVTRLGFEMVGAFCREMLDYRQKCSVFHQSRLTFVRHEDVNQEQQDEGFKHFLPEIRLGVLQMCQESLWGVQVYDNPLFVNGDIDPTGGRCACIVLKKRRPMFLPNGQPVTQWQKDESGKRVGDKPAPIAAKHRLTIAGNTIQLVPA